MKLKNITFASASLHQSYRSMRFRRQAFLGLGRRWKTMHEDCDVSHLVLQGGQGIRLNFSNKSA